MEMMQPLLAVLGVFLLLGASLWWLRHKGLAQFTAGSSRAGRRLELLERLALTPQHSLHLVRVDGRTILIALSPSGCGLVETGLEEPGRGEVVR
jgi:flagellar biogenesis protein FliO